MKLCLCVSLTQNELNMLQHFRATQLKNPSYSNFQAADETRILPAAYLIHEAKLFAFCCVCSKALPWKIMWQVSENHICKQNRKFAHTNFYFKFTICEWHLKCKRYEQWAHPYPHSTVTSSLWDDTNLFIFTRISFNGLMISIRPNILICCVVWNREEVLEAIILEWNWCRSLC